ncbi:MAG: hypothetical protein K0R38_6083 [Polyangiaceae bacterium]|nr:hypothetical protein [Polyangiaceae bacterium]
MRTFGIVIFALVAGISTSEARAEDPPASAKDLFKQGRELAGKGDYEFACPKFEESLALEVGVGTQFNLADCWEHIGRSASAHRLFLGAAASAKAAGQTDREQVLRDRATALEPRISKLVIEVASTDPKLTVKTDDLPLQTEQYGRAVAVDPGRYVISAKAPGKKPWIQKVDVKVGQNVVTVSVPELEAEAAKPVVVPAKAPPKKEPFKPVTPPPPASAAGDRDLSYTALGVGVLGVSALAFGTYMGVKYKSLNAEAKLICTSNSGCTREEISRHTDLVDQASFNRNFSLVGFGAGIAAVTTSVIMFALDKPKKSTASRIQAAPTVGAGFYGGAVSGFF